MSKNSFRDSKANSPDEGSTSSSRQQTQGQGSDLGHWQDDWQVVEFPHSININQVPGVDHSSLSKSMNPSNSDNGNTAISPDREAELVALIRDLNECNDVLLAKVSQLEESLDRSQSALQSEIERSQNNLNGADSASKGAEPRVSDRHIAQLVTELEYSNQALKRHQLLNETLQTELTSTQERVDQLEHDYAVVQQQHAEQSQALLQSENACRDLRSRLQRQQRYTMQFKAALEKCLKVSANTATVPASFVTAGQQDMALVSMPKAQHIQPWASESDSYAKLDPQLESLIRGDKGDKADAQPAKTAAQPTGTFEVSSQPVAQPKHSGSSDPAAEAQLWHDLARMIETPSSSLTNEDSDSDLLGDDLEDDVSLTEAAFAEDNPLQFTEPSPWETPIASEVPTSNVHVPEAPQAPPAVSVEVLADASSYVPAMTFPEGTKAPSPVVHPLRSQKRIKSLASVELPNFPKPQPRPTVTSDQGS